MTLNPEQVEKVIESLQKIERICDGTDGPAGLSDIDPFKTMEALAQEALAILATSKSVETEDGVKEVTQEELCDICATKYRKSTDEIVAAAREHGAREDRRSARSDSAA